MNRVELKEKAKASLEGKYGEAIKLLIVSALIGFIPGIISGIADAKEIESLSLLADLVEFVLSALISFGTLSFFLKISRDEEVTYKEIFAKKEMFLTFIVLSLITGILVLLWSLLLIIPGIIAALAYSQAMLVQLDNPDMDAMECIRESKRLMDGHKVDYLVLSLSFLGWLILGIFTFGILYLWLIPYISVTQANFYNALLEEKNK